MAKADDTSGAGAPEKRPARKRTATPARKPAVVKRAAASKLSVRLDDELTDEPIYTPEPLMERVAAPAPEMPVLERVVKRTSEVPVAPAVPVLQRGTVRHSDVTHFLRQLIMLLEAGTPILKSLRALSERGERAATRSLVGDIALYVESGNPVWQAFDRHPRYFDTVFVNLIKASEASGNLVPVLKRVTEYREQREMLTKRVRGAMWYPGLLVFACFGVMLLLTKFVVPEFAEMFHKANLPIPEATQKFLAVSDFFAVFWWVPMIAVVALFLVYKLWFVRSPVRRLFADRWKIKIPVIGPILHKNALVELTQTMAMLLRSGLSMMAALDLTRNAIHNRAVAQTLQSMRDSIEQGGSLEAPMRANAQVIPPVVTDMFVTGEETGRVDQVCAQIAQVYEEEVEIAVNTLGESLQPIFTVIIGIAVMILFVALFLPLVSMVNQLGNAGG